MIRSKNKALAGIMLVLTLALLIFFQALLMPKYMNTAKEGALIGEYYSEPKKHDVIFIGDCEVYENISTVTLWENYGISSYIRGSAQQLIWQSYYLLEETVKYEKPSVVFFNVLSMKYGTPQNEAYNRMTLDGMRWSASKVKSIKASMTEEETFASYVFPLLRFHSRWKDITKEDFTYLLSRDKVSYNGYLMQTGVRSAQVMPRKQKLEDYSLPDICYEYLDKITALCKENNIQLVLMKAPSIYPVWYDEWEEQIEQYAMENELAYINFLENMQETGIDLMTDTYDGGLHLNVYGAEKLADYMGEFLRSSYNLPDHRTEADYQKIWQEKIKSYYRERDKNSLS